MEIAKTALILIACHLIGDYPLQTDFIAKTKGDNWYHLFVHCILYAVPFYLAFGWCWQLAVITLLHFPIDALKARYKAITYLQDQVIHYILAALYLI